MKECHHNDDSLKARYNRAKNLMEDNWSFSIVANSGLFPTWIEGTDCFWYIRDINIHKNLVNPGIPCEKWDGEYRLVNVKSATNTLAFDHGLALALSKKDQWRRAEKSVRLSSQ